MTRANQKGLATISMVLMGLAFIAVLLGAVNLTSGRYSEQQAKLQEEIAAMTVMKDVALMVRRAYDISVGRGAAGCPAPGTVTYERTINGVRYCFPRRVNSCTRHPFETANLDQAPNLPLLCLDPSTPGNIKRVRVGFNEETFIEGEPRSWYVRFREGFGELLARAKPILLERARAQAAPKPWYPDVSGAASYTVQPTFPAGIRALHAHTCGPGVACVTLSVCLRLNRNCNAAEMVRQSFMFD